MSEQSRAEELADTVANVLSDVLEERLIAVYLHGSAVLGGFRWDRSDLDVLAVMEGSLSDAEVEEVVAGLAPLQYPGNGLEMSILTLAEARDPHRPAPLFQLHLGTEGWDRRLKVVDGRARDGDPDLVLHLLVCLAAGAAVIGPAPAAVLAAPPVDAVRGAVLEEIRWSLANDPPPEYVALTAARAWCYLATGRVASKGEAGHWAMDQVAPRSDAAAVLAAAVARQAGAQRGPTREQAQVFARDVLALLDGEGTPGRALDLSR